VCRVKLEHYGGGLKAEVGEDPIGEQLGGEDKGDHRITTNTLSCANPETWRITRRSGT
jgi:hypothetical protein